MRRRLASSPSSSHGMRKPHKKCMEMFEELKASFQAVDDTPFEGDAGGNAPSKRVYLSATGRSLGAPRSVDDAMRSKQVTGAPSFLDRPSRARKLQSLQQGHSNRSPFRSLEEYVKLPKHERGGTTFSKAGCQRPLSAPWAARRSTSRSSPPQRKVTGRIRQRRRQSIVKQILRQRSGSIHVSTLPKGKYYSAAANGDSEEEEGSEEEDDDNRQFGIGYVSLTISEQRKAMAKVLVNVRSGFKSPKKPSGMMKSVYDDSLRFALHHTGKLGRTLPRLEIPSLCVGRRLRERRDLMEFEKSPKRSDTNYRLHTHSWNL